MHKEEFIEWLVKDLGYPQKGAEIIYSQYLSADKKIQEALRDYKTNGIVTTLEIEGYSVKSLQEDHNMNVIASILTLDYLLKDPQKAIRSLKKGHDNVIITQT